LRASACTSRSKQGAEQAIIIAALKIAIVSRARKTAQQCATRVDYRPREIFLPQ
jgi:hypothetical protein